MEEKKKYREVVAYLPDRELRSFPSRYEAAETLAKERGSSMRTCDAHIRKAIKSGKMIYGCHWRYRRFDEEV